MRDVVDVAVVGAGIGGLSAAILLASQGLSVRVFESASAAGGKAGVIVEQGVEVDTGPSVLTLPHVFHELFSAVGERFDEQVKLVRPEPAFRYVFHDGAQLDFHQDLGSTIESIRSVLGPAAAREMTNYLLESERIWRAAAPHFVFAAAPNLSQLVSGGISRLQAVARIDALSTMERAIAKRVKDPYLQRVLQRFATYNGSDVRKAPATLGCIAHVELGLGGFGVAGGMIELVRALERAAQKAGVEFEYETRVAELLLTQGRVSGVRRADGSALGSRHVVQNADVGALRSGAILADGVLFPERRAPSMSAYTGVARVRRTGRPAHTVLFPGDYLREFSDIFDRGRVPVDPAIYLCAQEASHLRSGWAEHEPLFFMVNAPAVSSSSRVESDEQVRERVTSRLLQARVLQAADEVFWWRSPTDLAARFAGSDGSLYGDASSSMWSAFRRPPNRSPEAAGLYFASGSAHPGGGVPLVAQSGKQAAACILADRKAVS